MNSRSSVNETSLVNFSADLTSINPLDTKEPLLSFPFDHIYACHSETSDRRQTLQLDKEVEISTHCVVAKDKDLTERLASLENQNKKLKDLLIYHLDLIQQQNDLITKREKVYQALKQENDAVSNFYLDLGWFTYYTYLWLVVTNAVLGSMIYFNIIRCAKYLYYFVYTKNLIEKYIENLGSPLISKIICFKSY